MTEQTLQFRSGKIHFAEALATGLVVRRPNRFIIEVEWTMPWSAAIARPPAASATSSSTACPACYPGATAAPARRRTPSRLNVTGSWGAGAGTVYVPRGDSRYAGSLLARLLGYRRPTARYEAIGNWTASEGLTCSAAATSLITCVLASSSGPEDAEGSGEPT